MHAIQSSEDRPATYQMKIEPGDLQPTDVTLHPPYHYKTAPPCTPRHDNHALGYQIIPPSYQMDRREPADFFLHLNMSNEMHHPVAQAIT